MTVGATADTDKLDINRVIQNTIDVLRRRWRSLVRPAFLLLYLPAVVLGLLDSTPGPLRAVLSILSLVALIPYTLFLAGLIRLALADLNAEPTSVQEAMTSGRRRLWPLLGINILTALGVALGLVLLIVPGMAAAQQFQAAPADQTLADVNRKSIGCLGCHERTDALSMHDNPAVKLGCTDCHGGDASVIPPRGIARMELEYSQLRDKAHVLPKFPDEWGYPKSAKPQRSYTLLNRESPAFIRFVNPGDYRVAKQACGACHLSIIAAAQRSLMATGAMFFGGASYNNGVLPFKRYILGEAFTSNGQAAGIEGPTLPDPASALCLHGVLPNLQAVPKWESVPPADVFRVFEPGGRTTGNRFPEIALPNITGGLQNLNEPGRPDLHVSNRGPGTAGRVAIPVLNVHKTRLNDPYMWFMGTDDQPGDFRGSGCSGCHVVYANDRDEKHSGPTRPDPTSGAPAPTIAQGHPAPIVRSTRHPPPR